MNAYQIIKRPLHTEKSVADMQQNNRYHFEVDRRANKNQVREAVEQLFPEVKVLSVNTCPIRGKNRRMGWVQGRTPDRKKAMVKLRPGDTIDIGY